MRHEHAVAIIAAQLLAADRIAGEAYLHAPNPDHEQRAWTPLTHDAAIEQARAIIAATTTPPRMETK